MAHPFASCIQLVKLAMPTELVTHLALNGRLDQHIGHKAEVSKREAGDRRGRLGLQPLLDSRPFVGVPISRNHRVHHCDLHTIQVNTVMSAVTAQTL